MAVAVAIGAILLLALRPFRVPGWIWPVAGALLLVIARVEPFRGAGEAIARQWNVLLFIFGLMGVSAAADESGTLAWIADLVVECAGGSRRRLFVQLFLLCALVTLLLSNDATAITLTPIVYRTVSKRAVGDVKPFLLASIFVANVASFGLPFSNPANVLVLPHPRLIPYLWHLGPAQVAAIAVTFAIFFFSFRQQLKGRFEPIECPPPDPKTLQTLFALVAVVVAYVVALSFQWPLGPVALFGATLTFVVSRSKLGHVLAGISWKTLALLLGLFVLLDAVRRSGFVGFALTELDRALRYGGLTIDAIAAFGAALLSNAFNNLPVAVAASYIVAHLTSKQLAYPLIVGIDAGPNLMTSGSLATILWLAIVRGRGVRVTPAEYLRLGALIVPATIAVSLLWLWIAR